jgi:hypothetical protein
MNEQFKYLLPVRILFTGSSGSLNVIKVLENARKIFRGEKWFNKVVYIIGSEFTPDLSKVEFPVEILFSLPDPEVFKNASNTLFILDGVVSEELQEKRSKYNFLPSNSRHQCNSFFFLLQNLKTKYLSQSGFNVTILVAQKCLRNQAKLKMFLVETFPENWRHIYNFHVKVTSSKFFPYTVIDISAEQEDKYRFRDTLYPFEEPLRCLQLPLNV